MRYIYFLLIPIFLSAQTDDYPSIKIIDMTGVTNVQEDTWLIYRTHFDYKRNPKNIFESSIHYYNPKTSFDSLMWVGRHLSVIEIEIPGYISFWDNNPFKWIRFVFDEFSGTNYIYQFNYGRRFQKEIYGSLHNNRINISETQPNIVFLSYFDSTFVSSDSGRNWILFKDSIFVIGVNKFFNNIIYAINTENQLFFSNDGGNSFFISDDNTIWDRQTKIYFDKDKKYTYAIINTEDFAYFLQSSDLGKPYTWQILKTRELPIVQAWYDENVFVKINNQMYLTPDDSTSGSLFLSIGKNIYFSQEYGDNFQLFNKNHSSITGIYKKPNSNFLYISDHYGIHNVTQDTIITIKNNRPKNLERFYPLQTGNKWVYFVSGYYRDYGGDVFYSHYQLQEIIGDTIMPNSFIYKIIKKMDSNSDYISYSYQRYDSTSAIIEIYEPQPFELAINLLTIPGDTLSNRIQEYHNSVLLKEHNVRIFDEFKTEKLFQTFSLDGEYYSVIEDIGLNFVERSFDFGSERKELKGAVIKGIVYGDTTVTSLTSEPEIALEFQLSPNYPNPFNPTTTIEYNLPEAGFVDLKVCDINGRQVKNLVNKKQAAGKHRVVFDATSLTSGIYFYRLKSGGFSKTNKMILLK